LCKLRYNRTPSTPKLRVLEIKGSWPPTRHNTRSQSFPSQLQKKLHVHAFFNERITDLYHAYLLSLLVHPPPSFTRFCPSARSFLSCADGVMFCFCAYHHLTPPPNLVLYEYMNDLPSIESGHSQCQILQLPASPDLVSAGESGSSSLSES
jgi:hypothetical protein